MSAQYSVILHIIREQQSYTLNETQHTMPIQCNLNTLLHLRFVSQWPTLCNTFSPLKVSQYQIPRYTCRQLDVKHVCPHDLHTIIDSLVFGFEYIWPLLLSWNTSKAELWIIIYINWNNLAYSLQHPKELLPHMFTRCNVGQSTASLLLSWNTIVRNNILLTTNSIFSTIRIECNRHWLPK